MNTMNWVMSFMQNPYSRLKNIQWRLPEMVPVSFYGPEPRAPMESGTASTPRHWLTREHSTLTKYTSGPNTITIRTTSTPPQSKEDSSNTTTRTTSPSETITGTSSENVSTSLLP